MFRPLIKPLSCKLRSAPRFRPVSWQFVFPQVNIEELETNIADGRRAALEQSRRCVDKPWRSIVEIAARSLRRDSDSVAAAASLSRGLLPKKPRQKYSSRKRSPTHRRCLHCFRPLRPRRSTGSRPPLNPHRRTERRATPRRPRAASLAGFAISCSSWSGSSLQSSCSA